MDPRGRTIPCLAVADDHTLVEPELSYIEGNVLLYTESELKDSLSTGLLPDLNAGAGSGSDSETETDADE